MKTQDLVRKNLIINQSGQGLTEYLILLMIISIASITIVGSLGNTIRNKITTARNNIERDISPDPSAYRSGN